MVSQMLKSSNYYSRNIFNLEDTVVTQPLLYKAPSQTFLLVIRRIISQLSSNSGEYTIVINTAVSQADNTALQFVTSKVFSGLNSAPNLSRKNSSCYFRIN